MIYKYKNPEYFRSVPQPDYEKASGSIIIYGAGVNGAIIMRLLEKRGVKILCFADSDERKHNTEYFGYPVISPKDLYEKHSGSVVIVSPYHKGTLFEDLRAAGINEVYDSTPLFLEFEIDDVRDAVPPIMDVFHIAQTFLDKRSKAAYALTVVITEKCSLRCRECMAFVPYYKNPVDYSFKELSKALKLVLPLGIFPNIYLEGGETLLHEDLSLIVKEIISYDTVEHLWVITNGTIIPGAKDIQALKSPKVIVWISDYGEHSYNMERLKEELLKEKINFHSTSQHWYQVTRAFDYKRNDEENQRVFNNCCKGLDVLNAFIIKDRLYRCQFHARSEEFGIIPLKTDDSVDVLGSRDLAGEIQDFLNKTLFLNACRYCKGRGYDSIEVPVAEQITGEAPSLPVIKKERG